MSLNMVANVIGAVVLLAVISPWFLIAVAVVLLHYLHCAQYYRASSREFKRVDSILRSSLYSHFSESLSGISTIRAYGESQRFNKENVKRMDVENRGKSILRPSLTFQAYYMTIISE
jgi:ABC-type multidrug transport system fused ATPase/permease subunit